MIKIHRKAIDSISPLYHEFLSRFKKNNKSVYGFVEGKEDISFYIGFIQQIIPADWKIDLWAAGNRDKVIQLHSTINWSKFQRARIVFFIDRDLSDFIGEQLPNYSNIFITEGYSIENYIINRTTCNRLLCEILNLIVLPKSEQDCILNLFEEQLKVFVDALIPIMAWILYWKRTGEKPCLNDIYMKHIFTLTAGKVNMNNQPHMRKSIPEYIHNQCNVQYKDKLDISHIEKELKNAGNHKMIVRGKYLRWFLIEFALSVHKNIGKISSTIKSPPKTHISLGQSNGIILIAPRARIPEALLLFLKSTYSNYILQHKKVS